MIQPPFAVATLCAALAWPLAATAQSAPPAPTARPDPLNANAPVPRLNLPSSLSSYKGHPEIKPIPWEEANRTVNQLGGWRAYAREAQQAEGAVAPVSPDRAAPAPAPTAQPAPPAPGVHKH